MTSSKVLQAAEKIGIIEAILKAQNAGLSQIEAAKRRRDEIRAMGLLTEENDPLFMSSPASAIRFEDVNLVRALPHLLKTIEKQKGPKGDKGDSGKDGKDGIGKDGRDGRDGKDAIANPIEIMEIADAEVQSHKQEFDHTLIHDSKMIAGYELDVETLQEGDILQVKGKKLVGVKIPQPDMRPIQNWVASQGVSNMRSFPVTASRELDSMGFYIVDASAGNITITLPSAAGRENHWYEILRIDDSANTVTIVPTGSETMSGMTDYIVQQWTDVMLFAYNSNYLIRKAS